MAKITRIVFGSLLSLSVFSLATRSIDYLSESCPFDTDRTKKWLFVAIALISIIVLFFEFKKKASK